MVNDGRSWLSAANQVLPAKNEGKGTRRDLHH